jgi:hypothetical protein
MSNYTKATNFATKDTLTTGDSNKIVKGTEIDNEFNSISGAISSKADLASPTFTGTPAAPTATAGANTTQLATTAFVTAALQAVYPVGSIYVNATSSSNPASLLGFGTWEAFGAGRVMVGLNGSDADFDTAEETGGSKDATLPSHTHSITVASKSLTGTFGVRSSADGTSNAIGGTNVTGIVDLSENTGTVINRAGDTYATQSTADRYVINATHDHTATAASTGSSGTNANLQPYIVVRMWKRTA